MPLQALRKLEEAVAPDSAEEQIEGVFVMSWRGISVLTAANGLNMTLIGAISESGCARKPAAALTAKYCAAPTAQPPTLETSFGGHGHETTGFETSDLYVPNVAHYRAVLHPVIDQCLKITKTFFSGRMQSVAFVTMRIVGILTIIFFIQAQNLNPVPTFHFTTGKRFSNCRPGKTNRWTMYTKLWSAISISF